MLLVGTREKRLLLVATTGATPPTIWVVTSEGGPQCANYFPAQPYVAYVH